MKNITLPSKDTYRKSLIGKVESMIKRMRWKAHFFLHGGHSDSTTNKFGLNSARCLPQTIQRSKESETVKQLHDLYRQNTELIRNGCTNL